MTGHQPQLFHPGVWAKHFAVDRCAKSLGAIAVEVVVDSDRVGTLALRVPCGRGGGRAREIVLCRPREGACYACTPPPSAKQVERFAQELEACVLELPSQSIRSHAERFVMCLREAAVRTKTLAETVVAARRAFEAPAQTGYLELFVTDQSATESFMAFAAQVVADAPQFAEIFNDEVLRFRARTKTRSSAHPFPELGMEDGVTEVPFWVIVGDRRARAAYDATSGRLVIHDAGAVEVGTDAAGIASRIRAAGLRIVPKAVALTMFQRLFVADLFVHGVGGSRYEAVTDAIIERWLKVVPPPFAVVSLTMHVKTGEAEVMDSDIEAVSRRLREAEHNPDRLLAEAVFESVHEREVAEALVAEKRSLLSRFADPSVDKRALTAAIQDVNSRLRDVVRPLVASLEAELATLESRHDAGSAAADREVSFPFYDPLEVADRIR